MPKTRYIWDYVGDNVLMEKDEAGQTAAVYTHEPGQYGELISQDRSGQTSYYHYDGQGSTRQLTDENENVTDEYTYTAFGETLAESGMTTNTYRFLGQIGYDSDLHTTGIYVRARIYHPVVGRWLVQDPLWMYARNDLNAYTYCANNPVRFVDPSGLAYLVFVIDGLGSNKWQWLNTKYNLIICTF